MKHAHQNPALVAGMITLRKSISCNKTARFPMLFFMAALFMITGTALAQEAPDVLTGTGVTGAVCGPAEEPLPENNSFTSVLRGKIRFETGNSTTSTTMLIYFAAGKRNDTETFFRFRHSHLIESKILAKSLMYFNTVKAFRQAVRLQHTTGKLSC